MSDTSRSSTGTNWSSQGSANKPGQNVAKGVEALKDKVGDVLDRGKSGLADSAYTAGDSLNQDVAKLREDMAAIQKTLSKFASEAGNEAVKTAQNVGSAVTSQMGDVAQQVGETASEYASAAEPLGHHRRDAAGRRGDRDDVAGPRLMVATVLKLVGFDLQRQLARLKAQAEDFKDRTTDELKHKAVDAGLMIGLALAGLVFVVLTVIAGLIALYLWVEMERGRFAGLGAVALATAVLAALLFALAATRGKGKSANRLAQPKPVLGAPAAVSSDSDAFASSSRPISSGAPGASLIDDITQDLTRQAKTVANDALESAADAVRKSPREAILAALAVAVVAGVVVGRRR
jgi:ElaB/YqjD/DUF883 family membrane-anchored ribosome-binding protein